MLDYDSFPLSLTDIEGYDETNGTLLLSVDGVQKGDPISISFKKMMSMRGTIQLGASGIEKGNTVYYGSYAQSDITGTTKDPIKWRVLSTTPNGTKADGSAWSAGNGLLLLSDQNLDVQPYHVDNESVTWEGSTLRSWMNGYAASANNGGDSGTDYTSSNFINTAFAASERAEILQTQLENADNPSYSTARVGTNTAYVASKSNMRQVGDADLWWLRSPGNYAYNAAIVDRYGGVRDQGNLVYDPAVAARPAFNLDLNSVLFTSAAEGGKSAGGMDARLTSVSTTTPTEWKLTLKDDSRSSFTASLNSESSAAVNAGQNIKIDYSGAKTGSNEYVSAMLVNSSGSVVYYGRIVGNSESGTAQEIAIPADCPAGTYTLEVFSEQYNGGAKDDTKLTDYASPFSSIALRIANSGSDHTTTYPVNVSETTGGVVKVNPKNASTGTTVTVTATPDEGKHVDKVTITDNNGKEVAVTKNADGTFSFKMPSGKVTVEATFKPNWSNPFTDVSEKDWFYDGVAYVNESGLFAGTSATTFSPNDPMTRQQMWMVLARMAGETPANMDEARTWAMENNISDGSNPKRNVTREQFVTLLWRFTAPPTATRDMSDYADFDSVADYAKEAMRWAVESGIVSGTSDTTLSPKAGASRAQVAVILARYISK